jgi:hypothetical protein
MQLNSIEGIAVSLGVGAAFHHRYWERDGAKTIEILKIDNIRIRTLSIISNPEC